ncbi:hypothetical protein [Sporohalobacter salinus]|uniref:hypothetical protein n=1 Tax=Sporohalobacter salinus TaxID=1494606 RepID=UPI003B839335
MVLIKEKIYNLFKTTDCRNKDEIQLDLDGLEITMERCFAYDKPHEVSVFVPRAELRKKIDDGEKTEEIEILLNSITVVHSPQRPSNEEGGLPPEPPEVPRDDM